jgi:hypothetical protein
MEEPKYSKYQFNKLIIFYKKFKKLLIQIKTIL